MKINRVTSKDREGIISIYAAPNEVERKELSELLSIDTYDLDSALDPDEISRVEFEQNSVSMIWKQPKQPLIGKDIAFEVSSIGLFLRDSHLVIVTGNDPIQVPDNRLEDAASPIDFILTYLFYTIRNYLGNLKAIKQSTAELQAKIVDSYENRYFVQMFTLSESLIYYLNAIEANGAVLSKLSSRAKVLGLSEDQIDLLDDIRLENKQCARQAQIYGEVLSGLMDARGNIINNNMNMLLKTLMIINIIFLPLNLIAGIGGMSEFSMMTEGIHWTISYSVFGFAMCLIGFLTWLFLAKVIDGHGNGSFLAKIRNKIIFTRIRNDQS